MADDVTVPGTGEVLAFDDLGTKKVARTKVGHGVDGSYSDASDTTPFPTKRTAGTIGTGRTTVTTSGTEVQLSGSSVPCLEVTIQAETDNTNVVVVGGSAVVAALATRQGIALAAGESITLMIDNLNKVYIDAVTNTEGVTYTYLAV